MSSRASAAAVRGPRALPEQSDHSRRVEAAFLLALAAYVALWTVYGTVTKGVQDLHVDMAEAAAWSREPAWGYFKHPPLMAWLPNLWFRLFPQTEWAFYLLAMLMPAVALWALWRVSAAWLPLDKRVLAIAMLTFIPFFNFHALKFNANTVLLPTWALTALWFVRSYETRSPWYAVLAGIAAALAMLGKYWSAFLIAGLVATALLAPGRAAYFRSAAPWLTVGAGALALSPHLAWLVAHDFPITANAVERYAADWWGQGALSTIGYSAGTIGYAAGAVLAFWWAARPDRAAWRDILRPKDPLRRTLLLALVLPPLIPLPMAVFANIPITSLWNMPGYTLLPVVLLASPLVVLARGRLRAVLALAALLPLVAASASPLIAQALRSARPDAAPAHYAQLAAEVSRASSAGTAAPLRLVAGRGNVAFGVAFYLPREVSTLSVVDPEITPWADAARVQREGAAIVCARDDAVCRKAAGGYDPDGIGRHALVSITIAGRQPLHYVLVLVPPAR